KFCGLGARDTLRLEAALPLYGHEYTEEISPIEAGYSWAIKFEKGSFAGKDALLKIKNEGAKRVLSGIVLEEKGIPRSGFEVYSEEALRSKIGSVTSGTYSPLLKRGIALCYIDVALLPGTDVFLKIREKAVTGKIVKLPFYKRKE
ncbi:MAG: glycine cleavage system aminomethyltransferase GcvT, partial [Candidatus Saganbacteria bacterium]|nr:glycine cleavage system aminomethyltransferase GcvT [Candidatus Saganbacteria bacterium]